MSNDPEGKRLSPRAAIRFPYTLVRRPYDELPRPWLELSAPGRAAVPLQFSTDVHPP